VNDLFARGFALSPRYCPYRRAQRPEFSFRRIAESDFGSIFEVVAGVSPRLVDMLMQRALPLPTPARPAGVVIRPQVAGDSAALGALYWDSYPKGVAAVDLEDAIEEMEGVFEGEYGTPVESASLVVTDNAGALLGCIQTVTSPPWEGIPAVPFVIELFVHPGQRRRGLGSLLLLTAAQAVHEEGWESIALNVQEETAAEATHLYRALGFTEITPAAVES
jgi:GNAT superfamily N-acetyltransferase